MNLDTYPLNPDTVLAYAAGFADGERHGHHMSYYRGYSRCWKDMEEATAEVALELAYGHQLNRAAHHANAQAAQRALNAALSHKSSTAVPGRAA